MYIAAQGLIFFTLLFLRFIREESSQRDVAGSFTGLTTGGSAVLGAGRIAQLEAELKQSKVRL